MNRPEFKVIEGGIPYLLEKKEKFLVSAYVTNTRLMGVLAIHAHWRLDCEGPNSNLHQFFYIDCEEAGLETYKSISGDNSEELAMAEQALVGGLGANKMDITARQLSALLTWYKEFNNIRNLPLPKKQEEYNFLINPGTILNPSEHADLMRLICAEITSDYQAVNYFLMRCFAKDYKCAATLAAENIPFDLYENHGNSTFCKNTIDKDKTYDDGAISYLCESLVEKKGIYHLLISRVVVKDLKVVHFEKCSGFEVSAAEAAMMLSKAEYVTVYEVMISDEDMDNNIGELTVNLNTIMSTHENGRLFMAFKSTNDHVNSRVFRLSNDVKGVYYLTDYGQLIVSAYTLSDIRFLENKIKASLLDPYLMITAKYEFKEPVLFEFMQSDFEDFDDFLDFIKDE